LYKSIGWLLFYGLTGAAVFYLRLYSLHQNPIQELLAAITLGLMLLAGVFFYMALRPRLNRSWVRLSMASRVLPWWR
jgi:hypothetical protein